MPKKLQLSIPEPCHENWDNMTAVQQGKFCDSCQKQVVDFSIMSDRQLAEFFKKPSTGSVCGRFMTDQLDRNIEIPKKRIPWLKYFFQFVIPAFLFSLKSSAQDRKEIIVTARDIKKIPRLKETEMSNREIQGVAKILPVVIGKAPAALTIDSLVFNGKKDTGTNCITTRGNVSIRLGGVISVKTNGPLLVVDGLQQSYSRFKEIDPKIIDSISILKAVAAMTIYGPEGVEGAILITTKKINKIEPSPLKKETPKIPGIKVYPDPVQAGKILNLQFNHGDGQEKIIRIMDRGGKIVLEQVLETNKKKDLFQISTDPRWSAGIYFIQVLYENGRVAASGKVIIQ